MSYLPIRKFDFIISTSMPRPPKFRPRNIPCCVHNCGRYFTSWSGLSNHLRIHSAWEQQQRRRLMARDEHTDHAHKENPQPNTDDDDLFNELDDPIFDTQDEQDHTLDNIPRRKAGEKVITHPHINGKQQILTLQQPLIILRSSLRFYGRISA